MFGGKVGGGCGGVGTWGGCAGTGRATFLCSGEGGRDSAFRITTWLAMDGGVRVRVVEHFFKAEFTRGGGNTGTYSLYRAGRGGSMVLRRSGSMGGRGAIFLEDRLIWMRRCIPSHTVSPMGKHLKRYDWPLYWVDWRRSLRNEWLWRGGGTGKKGGKGSMKTKRELGRHVTRLFIFSG